MRTGAYICQNVGPCLKNGCNSYIANAILLLILLKHTFILKYNPYYGGVQRY